MELQIQAFTLVTTDLAESERFITEVFELEPTSADGQFVTFDFFGLPLEVVPENCPESFGKVVPLELRVKEHSELEDFYKRLEFYFYRHGRAELFDQKVKKLSFNDRFCVEVEDHDGRLWRVGFLT